MKKAYNFPGSTACAVEFYKGQWVQTCGNASYPCASTNPEAMSAVEKWTAIGMEKWRRIDDEE